MDNLSTTELFTVVIANQLVIMGSLRQIVTEERAAFILDKQIALTKMLIERSHAN